MSKKRDKNARKKKVKSRSPARTSVHHVDETMELDYIITDEPMDTNGSRSLPDEVQDQIEDLYDRIQVSPHGTIKELRELIERYPHMPQLYNYLYAAYQSTGRIFKAKKIMLENLERNPSYLFAKLNYAEYILHKRKFKEFTEVFDNKLTLTSLYPDRKVFHITEAISFNGVIGYYHAMIGEFHQANYHLHVLKSISPHDNQTTRLQDALTRLGKLAA